MSSAFNRKLPTPDSQVADPQRQQLTNFSAIFLGNYDIDLVISAINFYDELSVIRSRSTVLYCTELQSVRASLQIHLASEYHKMSSKLKREVPILS